MKAITKETPPASTDEHARMPYKDITEFGQFIEGYKTKEVTVLDEAKETIYSRDREEAYGEPKEHFDLVSALWSAFMDTRISPQDVCILMALLKVARLAKTPDHRDSLVDLAGYVGLIERVTK